MPDHVEEQFLLLRTPPIKICRIGTRMEVSGCVCLHRQISKASLPLRELCVGNGHQRLRILRKLRRRDHPVDIRVEALIEQLNGCRARSVLLVSFSNEAQGGRRICFVEKRAGSLNLILHIWTAAIDHYGARSDHAGDLGISEAFQMLPKNAILRLFVSAIAAVKIMRNERRLKTGVERGGIECGQSALAGADNTNPSRINTRERTEKINGRQNL